ncbi:TonB-dependent receptor [Candidatus Palauibacter polyketidifaciens]|uniref:TonB-dependent receptor n=1 Tax=Candidatus Palauibacter polyketidifaciens TaxID=3056740 RepID=UPI00239A11A3|nr:TonB-dependent receptor [Candidatus Palauibacter polyketidifaciens]MDE2720132.1 TonB-dependent receptor [Candidatus Palauibacter polyketidifaciens]
MTLREAVLRSRRYARGGFLVLALGGLTPATALEAQDPVPADSVISLGELIVSALRAPTSVGEVPVNVTTVTREELRLSAAQTLQDVLQEVPGLNFRFPFQAGVAHPSWQAVTLRGLGGTAASRTLVLVDGVPLNDPYFGWVRWSQVPVEVIERIEIVRGGATVSWGSQSLAGVVHVITRSGGGGGFSASAQGGSQSTFRGDAMASFGDDRAGGYVAGELFNSDGYILTEPSLRGAVDIPSASSHGALRAKVEFQAGDRLRIHAQGNYFDQDKDNATPLRNNTTEAGFGQVGATLTTGETSSLAFNAYMQSQSYVNSFSGVEAGRNSEEPSISQDVPSSGVGANLVWSGEAGTIGVDFLRATGSATERYLYRDGAFARQRETGGDQTLFGLFSQLQTDLGDRWRLWSGGRLDVWRNSSGSRHILNTADRSVLTDDAFEDRSGTQFSLNTGILYDASEQVALRASVYTGLRVPTLNELYKPFRAAGNVVNESNEALNPEKVTGLEIGVDFQPDPAVLVRLTGFHSSVRNAITDVTIQEAETSGVIQPCGFVAAGGVCRRRDNVGTLRSVGLETEIELRPSAVWLLAVNHQYNPTEVTDAPGRPDLIGNEVQGSPTHRAMLRVGHIDPSTLEVVATARYLGARFDNDLNTGEIAGSFLLDVRFRRQLTSRLSAFASVQNLFDAIAEMSHDANGFIRVGAPRTLIGGLRVRFGG